MVMSNKSLVAITYKSTTSFEEIYSSLKVLTYMLQFTESSLAVAS